MTRKFDMALYEKIGKFYKY